MYTVAEVAKRLRVSVGAIYGAVQSGRLKAYRIGARGRGAIRIPEESLRNYLESCEVKRDTRENVTAEGRITLPRRHRPGQQPA